MNEALAADLDVAAFEADREFALDGDSLGAILRGA